MVTKNHRISQRENTLSVEQLNAIDLLVQGRTDLETAEMVGESEPFPKNPIIKEISKRKVRIIFYRFIARTPHNMDKLPFALRHFLVNDLSFSSSSVAKAFASCSVVMSK